MTYFAYGSFVPVQRQDQGNVTSPSMDRPVYERGLAFSWYLARRAAEDDQVKRFRQRVLGGSTVSYKEAVAFVDSPASAVFSLEWFEERGVPFIGHKAQVLQGDWPLIYRDPKLAWGEIKLEWGCEELVSYFESVAPSRGFRAKFSGPEDVCLRELDVLGDSVLGVLWNLAQQLGRFPGWEAIDIPMFVLTGWARIVGRPYITHNSPSLYHPVSVNVPPWFSAEDVSRVYKGFKNIHPTKPQPSPRRLSLFGFVIKQPEVTVSGEGGVPNVPSWAALLRSWNECLPSGHEWRYKDRRNLRRDFLAAFDQIVNYHR